MIKHSRHPQIPLRVIQYLIALALISSTLPCSVTTALAQEPAEWIRVQSQDLVFSIEIPRDWRFEEIAGRGARLLSPERGPVVEVVAWNALRPPGTPETAATEHEGVLSRAVDYRRDGVEEITTDEGASALVVSGRVRWRGATEGAIFCAYSRGATHYVLGTFVAKEALAELRESVLDRMMRSFRTEAGGAPVTTPPAAEPEADLQPDTPPAVEIATGTHPDVADAPTTLQIGGHSEPVGPEIREPANPWIEHRNPAGFSVAIPVDRQVETIDGIISITPAVNGTTDGAVLIWPVTGPDPGAEAALRMALTRVPELRLLRVTSIEEISGATLIQAEATGGKHLAATWAHGSGFGLLQVVAAPEASWQKALPRLARMVVSFRPGRWPVSSRRQSEVVGEMRILRWELPAGWEARGGVREDNGELSIDIEALDPSEPAFRVCWQQPMQPRFRALTPLLESLGWRENERYSAPEGGEGLMIHRRREPEQLVRDMLLPRDPLKLRLTAIDASPTDGSIASLLPQPDATGQAVAVKGIAEGESLERLYLVATATAEEPLSTTCWDAAFLMAGAPKDRLEETVEVLTAMVRSARVGEHATSAQADRIEAQLDRARRAVASIGLEPQAEAGLRSVLGGEGPVTATSIWSIPGAALEHWSRQGADASAVNIIDTPIETRRIN